MKQIKGLDFYIKLLRLTITLKTTDLIIYLHLGSNIIFEHI